MSREPELLNGVRVPNNADVNLLRSQLAPPGPQAWAACLALGHHPSPEALEVLMDLTTSPDWSYRRAAVEAIAAHRLGKSALERLRTLLDDPSLYVVRTACEAAIKLELHEIHDSLLPLLSSQSPFTRQTAVRALAGLWKPSDFARVFSIFERDPSIEVRREAAWTLRANADREGWQVLFDSWKQDQLARRRIWACELAAEFADSRFQNELEQIVEDPDGHVRKAAQQAIETLANRSTISP